jgi:hypothetical protein
LAATKETQLTQQNIIRNEPVLAAMTEKHLAKQNIIRKLHMFWLP